MFFCNSVYKCVQQYSANILPAMERRGLSRDSWSSQTFPFVLVEGDDDWVMEILCEFSMLPAADE